MLKRNGILVGVSLGLVWLALLALVFAHWDSSKGLISVSTRLYIFQWLGLSAAVGCLAALSFERGRRLAAAQVSVPTVFELSEGELAILEALAADPYSMSESEIAKAAGLSGNRFKLHWHRVFGELKLIECEERRLGIELFALSQSGRRVALERGLL